MILALANAAYICVNQLYVIHNVSSLSATKVLDVVTHASESIIKDA
jgi:hypothetical protein